MSARKPTIIRKTIGRSLSVLEILAEKKRKLSIFDPEDFHEMRPVMPIEADSKNYEPSRTDSRRTSIMNFALFSCNVNILVVFGRALLMAPEA